jgi:hypothetical protein
MPGRLPDKRIDLTRRRRGPSTVRSVHQVETVVGLVDDSGR